MSSSPTIDRIDAEDTVVLALVPLNHAMRIAELLRKEALGRPEESVDLEDLGMIEDQIQSAISQLKEWVATFKGPLPQEMIIR